jgi:hypothetical protein
MPTLVIDNVPASLYDQIQRVALGRKRSPADTVLELLETALRPVAPGPSEPPPPSEIFLPTEMSAPFDIPWPEGELVQAIKVPPPLPTAHDFPDQD